MLDTYSVTVRRSGVSPIRAEMLVAADSKRAAGELASAIAEQERGGIFGSRMFDVFRQSTLVSWTYVERCVTLAIASSVAA